MFDNSMTRGIESTIWKNTEVTRISESWVR
jgi:hypothetical protein